MGLKDPLQIPLTHLNIRGMVLLQINLLEWLEPALKFVLRSQRLYLWSQTLYAELIYGVETNFSVRFGPNAWTSTKLN